MLFCSAICAYAQPDTAWVANRCSSIEWLAVSPDERFVVAVGEDGWENDPDHPDGQFEYGTPAKIFNAETGEWIISIFDSTAGAFNEVRGVNFSPDSTRMFVHFWKSKTLVIDLNNNFAVIDTIPIRGAMVFTPDGSKIMVNNTTLIDGNTYEIISKYDYEIEIEAEPKPYIETQNETVGIFRKNGTEYVFSYYFRTGKPIIIEGTGRVIMNIVDSTVTVEKDKAFTQWYYRTGCKYYTMYDTPTSNKGNYSIYIRDIVTDSIINKNWSLYSNMPLQMSADSKYLVLYSGFRDISNGEMVCNYHEYITNTNVYGNRYHYVVMPYPDKKIMAIKPCIDFLGIPPIIQGHETTYPMPSKDRLSLDIDLEQDIYTAEIHDISGKKIEEINMGQKSGLEKIEINTIKLIPGTYFLLLKNSKQTKTYKFIKE